MKDKTLILRFTIFSIIFTTILGVILHFTYEWSNGNLIIASFSAVNESTWEHLKLLFFPMLITTIIGYFFIGKNNSSFLCARALGILTAILFTIIFFYTYTGVLGINIDILNIASFFIAVFLGEYVSYKVLLSYFSCDKFASIVLLVALFFYFVFFTYNPPKIGLFKDPLTNKYGIIDSNF